MTEQQVAPEHVLKRRAFSVMSELGFNAAEVRALSARLAAACARQDMDEVCDLAEALKTYHEAHEKLYTRLLIIPLPHQDGRRLPYPATEGT